MGTGAGADRREIREPGSVLLVSEPFSAGDDRACIDLLTQTPPAETAVVSVTFDTTPAERVAVWQREYGETLPAGATVVDGRGGVGAATGTTTECAAGAVDVEVLPSEAGLFDITATITRQLGRAAAADTTQLCVHSLSALADRFGAAAVAEFAAVLNRLCERHGVVAHHHVAHDTDEELLAMLRPQYEVVAETVGDGWAVTESDSESAPDRSPASVSPGGLWTAPSIEPLVSVRYSFDTVLDLISNPVRRSLLYYLQDRGAGTYGVAEVSEAVARRLDAVPIRESRSQEAVERMCIHVHFPKLADVGLAEVDHEAGTVTVRDNPALEQILGYVEQLELG